MYSKVHAAFIFSAVSAVLSVIALIILVVYIVFIQKPPEPLGEYTSPRSINNRLAGFEGPTVRVSDYLDMHGKRCVNGEKPVLVRSFVSYKSEETGKFVLDRTFGDSVVLPAGCIDGLLMRLQLPPEITTGYWHIEGRDQSFKGVNRDYFSESFRVVPNTSMIYVPEPGTNTIRFFPFDFPDGDMPIVMPDTISSPELVSTSTITPTSTPTVTVTPIATPTPIRITVFSIPPIPRPTWTLTPVSTTTNTPTRTPVSTRTPTITRTPIIVRTPTPTRTSRPGATSIPPTQVKKPSPKPIKTPKIHPTKCVPKHWC